MADIEEALASIENLDSHTELEAAQQKHLEDLGFSSFCFVDGGTQQGAQPFYVGTDPAWTDEYSRNGFAEIDPCVANVRRANKPFRWSEVPLPARRGKRKPGGLILMEAARDYGFEDGVMVPLHFVDRKGRYRSAFCSGFWKQDQKELKKSLLPQMRQLHIYQVYWMHRSMEMRSGLSPASHSDISEDSQLTDREKDVISWAARGKTAAETAIILNISVETVITHIRNATGRLGAGNKTHAVALALTSGQIDL